jgi:Fe-S oxidoreductase
MEATFAMLNVPKKTPVTIYNSGCCGMAGSLDMKEHYEISMQMGEDTISKIRATDPTAIAAAGTSCHQILTEPVESLHPVSILRSCLK